jgi:hypothetical protein
MITKRDGLLLGHASLHFAAARRATQQSSQTTTLGATIPSLARSTNLRGAFGVRAPHWP